MDDPRWQEAQAHLETLKRQSAAFVIARRVGDPVAAFVAAWWARRTLRMFRAWLDDSRVRPDLAPVVDDAIAEHLAVFELPPQTFAAADSARVMRWMNARRSSAVVPTYGELPHLFELAVGNLDAGALDLDGLALADSYFDAVALDGSSFESATVQGCHFWNVDLERTSWRGARVERSTFHWCDLVDANLDGATFAGCIFYDVDFGARDPAAGTRASFIRCDLRAVNWDGRPVGTASFDGCQFDERAARPDAATARGREPQTN